MPITVLDENAALVLIDLQRGVVSLPVAHPIKQVVANAVRLLATFREKELPVVLVRVTGVPDGRADRARRSGTLPSGWDELIPELRVQPSDYVVAKNAVGAFASTALREYLEALGVTQLVIGGVSTSSGVESTVRQAFDYGFNLALPLDAMTDTSLEAHNHSVTTIFPKFGETGTTGDIVALLTR